MNSQSGVVQDNILSSSDTAATSAIENIHGHSGVFHCKGGSFKHTVVALGAGEGDIGVVLNSHSAGLNASGPASVLQGEGSAVDGDGFAGCHGIFYTVVNPTGKGNITTGYVQLLTADERSVLAAAFSGLGELNIGIYKVDSVINGDAVIAGADLECELCVILGLNGQVGDAALAGDDAIACGNGAVRLHNDAHGQSVVISVALDHVVVLSVSIGSFVVSAQSSALQSQHHFTVYDLSLDVPAAVCNGCRKGGAGENGGKTGGSIGGHVNGVVIAVQLQADSTAIELKIGGDSFCGGGAGSAAGAGVAGSAAGAGVAGLAAGVAAGGSGDLGILVSRAGQNGQIAGSGSAGAVSVFAHKEFKAGSDGCGSGNSLGVTAEDGDLAALDIQLAVYGGEISCAQADSAAVHGEGVANLNGSAVSAENRQSGIGNVQLTADVDNPLISNHIYSGILDGHIGSGDHILVALGALDGDIGVVLNGHSAGSNASAIMSVLQEEGSAVDNHRFFSDNSISAAIPNTTGNGNVAAGHIQLLGGDEGGIHAAGSFGLNELHIGVLKVDLVGNNNAAIASTGKGEVELCIVLALNGQTGDAAVAGNDAVACSDGAGRLHNDTHRSGSVISVT